MVWSKDGVHRGKGEAMSPMYDSWKASVPEDRETLPAPCPVCTGDGEAMPCGEDCARLIAECERQRRIRGIYLAAKRALKFARTYYELCGRDDYRVKSVVKQVYFFRQDIAVLRSA